MTHKKTKGCLPGQNLSVVCAHLPVRETERQREGSGENEKWREREHTGLGFRAQCSPVVVLLEGGISLQGNET